MIKIPKWLYSTLAVIAVVLVATQMTLVGQVSWLAKGGNGAQYVTFGLSLMVLLGFGAAAKDGIKVETETTTITATTTKPSEPAPLPPPPDVKP